MVIPPLLLKIRGLLTKLTDFLILGRKAGAWSVENTPRFLVGNTPAPQGLLGGPVAAVKGKIREKVVKIGVKNIQKRIDTPEERKVILDRIHVPGIPTHFAWILSAFVALLDAALEAASTSDVNLLMTDWRQWLHIIGVAVVTKFLLWLKEDSHQSTVVLDAATVKNVAEEVK